MFTAIAAAQVNMPPPGLPGSSPDYAVRVVAQNELMVDRFVQRWLRTHYPGWEADQYDLQDMGPERYAVVNISAANHPNRKVYFRIIENQNDPEAREGGAFPF